MPNPNVSEIRLRGWYGEDADKVQATNIYTATSDDSDQIEHKFISAVDIAGQYVELVYFSAVKQIVAQNISSNTGVMFYADALTGAIVPQTVLAGEHISFCSPNVVLGLGLFAWDQGLPTDWHLAIIGER